MKTQDQSCTCNFLAIQGKVRDDVTNDEVCDDRDDDADVMADFDDAFFCSPQNSQTMSVSMTMKLSTCNNNNNPKTHMLPYEFADRTTPIETVLETERSGEGEAVGRGWLSG